MGSVLIISVNLIAQVMQGCMCFLLCFGYLFPSTASLDKYHHYAHFIDDEIKATGD